MHASWAPSDRAPRRSPLPPRPRAGPAEALAEVSPDGKTRAEMMSDGSTATESDGVTGI